MLKNIVCGDGGSQSHHLQVKPHEQISEADLEEIAVPWLKIKIMSTLFRADVMQVVDFHWFDRFSKHQLSPKQPVRRR